MRNMLHFSQADTTHPGTQVRQTPGGWPAVARALFAGTAWGAATGNAAGAHGAPPHGPGGSHGRRGQRATLDQVMAALQKLPTEVFVDEEGLDAMSSHDLKVSTAGMHQVVAALQKLSMEVFVGENGRDGMPSLEQKVSSHTVCMHVCVYGSQVGRRLCV